MKTYKLDISELHTKEAFHLAVGKMMSLPDYYGKNLDALFDCLTGLSEPSQIVLDHSSALEKTWEITAPASDECWLRQQKKIPV